jgi:hypothetical protein
MRQFPGRDLLWALCCVSCVQSPEDARREIPRAKALGLDPFGVSEIYPTKAGGREWYLPAAADVADAEWKPTNGVTKNPDGTFHMNTAQGCVARGKGLVA